MVDLLDSVGGLKTLLGGYFGHLAPYFMPKRFALLSHSLSKISYQGVGRR